MKHLRETRVIEETTKVVWLFLHFKVAEVNLGNENHVRSYKRIVSLWFVGYSVK